MKLTFLGSVLKENYRMSDICKDREALRLKYEQFIQTEKGKTWKHFWQTKQDLGTMEILEIICMIFIQKCYSKEKNKWRKRKVLV